MAAGAMLQTGNISAPALLNNAMHPALPECRIKESL